MYDCLPCIADESHKSINSSRNLGQADLKVICTGLPRKDVPVCQCFTLGTLKNLVCHVWWALQYLALWATNRN